MAITTTITTMTITIMDDGPDEPRQRVDRLSVDLKSAARTDESALSSPEKSAQLLIWLSPSFPVGSFAFSHGLEWAVNAGHIHDVTSATGWLETLVEHGTLRNDAILAASAWRAASTGNALAVREINELALAMAGSRERYLETSAQGNAFVAVVRDAWATSAFAGFLESLKGDIAYPIAVATASAAHDIALPDMLRFYTLALVQNLISAAVRLSVIGHTDGQRAIAALLPPLAKLSGFAERATLEDLGGAAFLSDIASMRHETQYSRLFRS